MFVFNEISKSHLCFGRRHDFAIRQWHLSLQQMSWVGEWCKSVAKLSGMFVLELETALSFYEPPQEQRLQLPWESIYSDIKGMVSQGEQ